MKKSRVWNAFLPIGSSATTDKVEEVDADWLAARGCTEGALRVLRAIRQEVVPVVLRPEFSRAAGSGLRRYSCLIHDHTSGVPCLAEDSRPYAHLRLVFVNSVTKHNLHGALGEKWCHLTPVSPSADEERVHAVLDAQCEWYLRVIRDNEKLSDIELLQLIRQHLHYFANMAQMRVQ